MRALVSSVRRLAAADQGGAGPAILVGLAHGATHWINTTFYVLLPFVAAELGLSYTLTGSLVTVFFAASFITNIGSGPLVDIGGRSVMLQAVALVIGGLGLIVLGLAGGTVAIALSVGLIGISVSLWHPAAIPYLSRRYRDARGLALSIHTLGASLGDTVAPLIAGFLLLALSWQETAFANAVPMFLMAAVIVYRLQEERPSAGAPRSGSGGYLKGVRTLLRNRTIIRLCVMAAAWSMTQSGVLVFLPLYLVGELQASSAVVGIALMLVQLGGMVGGPFAGVWSDQIGRRPVVLAALSSATVLLASLALFDGAIGFIAVVSLVGFALFSIRPVVHSWTMDLAADATSASAVSLLFATQAGFTVLVPAAGGMVADAWGLAVVFHLMALTALVAAVLAFTMPRTDTADGGPH